jgi:D-arginine dehydrogenase
MERTDVLIVGGGIAGTSLGARLAGKMAVTIIEAEDLCGFHATGRSAAFWQASLGGDTPERRLSLASKPMFDANWPSSEAPLLRPRGALHLTGPCGEAFAESGELSGEHLPIHLDRAQIDRLIPGLREQWTGAWFEASCADIEVAAFHDACLRAVRRQGGKVQTGTAFIGARLSGSSWYVETNKGPFETAILVNAAGAWGDEIARRASVEPLGLLPLRRTVVQLRVGRTGLGDVPFVTDSHQSFYFKGESDNSVWVCPLDEALAEPGDVAPEEMDVAIAIDRFEQAVDWPVEAVERKWAGLRTFAPDRGMKFGFDPQAGGFFWCVGQGGMGIQTAPAASLLCESLIEGDPLPADLNEIDPQDFAPRFSRPA